MLQLTKNIKIEFETMESLQLYSFETLLDEHNDTLFYSDLTDLTDLFTIKDNKFNRYYKCSFTFIPVEFFKNKELSLCMFIEYIKLIDNLIEKLKIIIFEDKIKNEYLNELKEFSLFLKQYNLDILKNYYLL